MEEYLTPHRIANSIMQDVAFTGHYLIVEGKKDSNLFGRFINHSNIRIEQAFGKQKVKEILEILNTRGFERKLGIVDADFMELLGETIDIDDLFVTDDHDIEIMMIKSKALDDLISIFSDKDKVTKFESTAGTSVRDILFQIGLELGNLKLANKLHNLGLVFKPGKPEGNQLKYKKFICDKKLLYLGKEKLINTAYEYSTNRGTTRAPKSTIDEVFETIKAQKYNPFHLANGHDLSNILFIFLKDVLRSTNKMLFDFNTIEDCLILAYSFSDFKKTVLYSELDRFSKTKAVSLFSDI
ncbi:MAG: DUF4435 domain-containing protein [Sulfuricurvum sp.]|nr:DUF4435 domain-containing protein [Sulfuricurvum sp.]